MTIDRAGVLIASLSVLLEAPVRPSDAIVHMSTSSSTINNDKKLSVYGTVNPEATEIALQCLEVIACVNWSPVLYDHVLLQLVYDNDGERGCLSGVRHFYCSTAHQIFTALHGMQTRSCDEISVCPSVRLSVCQTRVLWQNGRKIYPDFYTLRKNILSSFMRRRMVGGRRPLLSEILG